MNRQLQPDGAGNGADGPGGADPHAVAAQLLRTARSVEAGCFADGLNPAQWAALRYFARANRFSRSAAAFARFQGTSRGTASQSIRSLVDKGLLCSRRDPRDRRVTAIGLSEAGHAALQRDPVHLLERAVAGLAPSERSALSSALAALAARLGARLQGFGRCRDCDCLHARAGGEYLCAVADERLGDEELDCICVDHRPAALPRSAAATAGRTLAPGPRPRPFISRTPEGHA